MKGKENVTKSVNFLRKTENHFAEIAPRYRKLRTTDMEPILLIEEN